MHRSAIAATLVILTALPMAVFAASNSDGEFRGCAAGAMDAREGRMMDALGIMEGEWMGQQGERRGRLGAAWGIEDDRTRRNEQDNAIRDYNRARNDSRKRYDDTVRNAEREYRDRYNTCYQEFKNRERARRDEQRRQFDFQ